MSVKMAAKSKHVELNEDFIYICGKMVKLYEMLHLVFIVKEMQEARV